jgi:hypothetical protein
MQRLLSRESSRDGSRTLAAVAAPVTMLLLLLLQSPQKARRRTQELVRSSF